MRKLILTLIAVGGLVLGGSAPAFAATTDHGFDSGTEVLVDFCGSTTDFNHEFDYRRSSMIKNGPNAPLYFADHFSGTDTWTNLDTGKSFTVMNHGTFRDQKITVNADGTLTIVQQFDGNQIVRDDAGHILFVDAAVVRFEVVVNSNGTLDNADDDTLIEDRGVTFQRGRTDTADRDFCTDVLQFTA